MTRWLLPLVRRGTQGMAFLAMILLPVLALYTHYFESHALHDLDRSGWRHQAVVGVERFVGKDEGRRTLVQKTQGTVWSARICGFSISDPLAGAEAILSSRTFYQPMVLSLVIPVTITILLGRVFCGWLCPMNTVLELVDKLRGLLRVAEIRERDVKFSLRSKYLVLMIVLGLVAFSSVPFVALIYPPAVLSREIHLMVFGSTLGLGAYLVLSICAIELFISKRWWCRYVCPGGALYSLLGRFRLIRVVRDQHRCVQCGDCVRVCQFDLRPMLVQVTGMECTNCGSCVGACHDDALRFQFMLPIANRSMPARSSRSDSTSGSNSLTVLSLMLLCFSVTVPAQAHHILGLPHYSYKENYPQAPTLEYPATTGPYDVLMTSFPGHPVPGETTSIAFYIKDRNTGLPYPHPVSLRVLQTATFGSNTLILEPTIHAPTTNQHKFVVTFPTDGEFITELTMEVEGKPEVIPFLMVAGQPSAAGSVVVTTLIGLGAFLLIVRAIRIKRRRKVHCSKFIPNGAAAT